MDKKEIFDKVSSIVADHFDIDRAKITEDLNLKTDLDADSIDFVLLVLKSKTAKPKSSAPSVKWLITSLPINRTKNKQNHRDRDEALLCRRSFFQWKLHERKFFSLKN